MGKGQKQRERHIQESLEVSPIQICDHIAARNRHDIMTETITNNKTLTLPVYLKPVLYNKTNSYDKGVQNYQCFSIVFLYVYLFARVGAVHVYMVVLQIKLNNSDFNMF